MEDLNVNIVAPFQFQDYIFGFKYALGDIKKVPETLFASKSFETPLDGKVSFNTEFDVKKNVFGIFSQWASKSLGLAVSARGNTHEKLQAVDVRKSFDYKNNRLTLNAAYDVIKKKISGSTSVNIEQDTEMQLQYDSVAKDPVFTLTRQLDAHNEVSPSVSLKTGKLTYGMRRRWEGGSLKAQLAPGETLGLEWRDEGVSGAWVTSAEIPVGKTPSAPTKITFSRDWNY